MLAGSFYVEGSETGDTLTVKILDLQVDGNSGVGAYAPGFGALSGSHHTPVLEPLLTERVWFITSIMHPTFHIQGGRF